MKKCFAIVLAVMLTMSFTGCGNSTATEKPQETASTTSATEPADIAPALTMEDLCGIYVSTKDETVRFHFTLDSYAEEDQKVISCPVYLCQAGKDERPFGVYSLKIEGSILTVTDTFGSPVFFEIIKTDECITLEFLEEKYDFSFLGHPDDSAFLSNLVKTAAT